MEIISLCKISREGRSRSLDTNYAILRARYIFRDKFNNYVIELRRSGIDAKIEIPNFSRIKYLELLRLGETETGAATASQYQQHLDQRSLRLWLYSPVQRARRQDHALGEEPTPTPTPSSLPPLLNVRSRRPRSLFFPLSYSIPLSPLATLASHPPSPRQPA